MAENLDKLLKDPKARVLVFCGAEHAESTTQPEHLKNIYGIASRSYSFLFGGIAYDKAVALAGKSKERLLIPLPKQDTNWDGLISIPEIITEAQRRYLRRSK